MQQVGQVVVVEDIDPEGHEKNRSQDRSGSPPGPQQPGHESKQGNQANDPQQQEPLVNPESGRTPQPARYGRAQNARGERRGHFSALPQRQQAILPCVWRIDGPWQPQEDGKAQTRSRKKPE